MKFMTLQNKSILYSLLTIFFLFVFVALSTNVFAGGDGGGDGGGGGTGTGTGTGTGASAAPGCGNMGANSGGEAGVAAAGVADSDAEGAPGADADADGGDSGGVDGGDPGDVGGYSQGAYYSQGSYGPSYSQGGYYSQGAYTPTPPPTLTPSSGTINAGSPTTITWSCPLSSASSGVNFSTGGAPSGSVTVNPTETTQYIINCPVEGQSQITITVLDPELSISANPDILQPGSTSQITWSGQNVDSCSVTGPNFSASGLSGSQQTAPINEESLYTLVCTNQGGSKNQSVTVRIAPSFEEF
ncbi:MAG: hypothetical protein QF858_03975 [Candidatus Pacebacteria bacterium]|nr:hypothetical protein [Candidatus Paceibacterota bacterium]MDP6659742.1 hypothetical protein [Candidatus Paceibacterota bacterium]